MFARYALALAAIVLALPLASTAQVGNPSLACGSWQAKSIPDGTSATGLSPAGQPSPAIGCEKAMKFAAVNATGGMPTCNYCAEPDACEPYVEPQGSGTDLNGSGSCIHLGGGVYQWTGTFHDLAGGGQSHVRTGCSRCPL